MTEVLVPRLLTTIYATGCSWSMRQEQRIVDLLRLAVLLVTVDEHPSLILLILLICRHFHSNVASWLLLLFTLVKQIIQFIWLWILISCRSMVSCCFGADVWRRLLITLVITEG